MLLAGGALVIPVARYPAAVRSRVLELLPTAALGEGCAPARSARSCSGRCSSLLVWTGLGALAAWKGFRWTS